MSIGCDEAFNPKVLTEDRYVLHCFVEGEYGKKPVTLNLLLARVYDVDGLDPYLNTTDPAVAGAEVTFMVNDKPYFMSGGIRHAVDSTRYGPRERFYFCSLPAPEPLDVVSVWAELPDGRTISAQTVIPKARAFASSYAFSNGITTRVNLPPGVRSWTIDWEDYEETGGHLFFPRLRIEYSKSVGGREQSGSVEVPSRYVWTKDGPAPIFPSQTTQKLCTFEFPAIDSAMVQISAGDSAKGSYSVSRAMFEVIEYDTPLSKYFSSVGGSLDQFSIRVNQTVYSNINGGVGIFGSYYSNWAFLDLNAEYVKSFGYRYR